MPVDDETRTLSPSQCYVIAALRSQPQSTAGVDRYLLIRQGRHQYAKGDHAEFPVQCSDQDLLALARMGYIELYSSPPSIVPTSLVWRPLPTNQSKGCLAQDAADVLKLDIRQVHAWLLASIAAAVCALLLLALTVIQVLSGNASAGSAATAGSLISSVLTLGFFRQYDRANQRLRGLRHRRNVDK